MSEGAAVEPAAAAGSAAPAAADEGRLESLDVLRGLAGLGILLMNIVGVGLPYAYDSPATAGGDSGADLAAWFAEMVLFEGTQRGLFTLLFGAGVLLFASRVEARAPARVADFHARRMLWLGAFGFVNSHLLLFSGDILFEYAVAGLSLLAFRQLRPRPLTTIAVVLLSIVTARGALDWQSLRDLAAEGVAARQVQAAGDELSEEQSRALEAWEDQLAELRPDDEAVAERIEAMRGGFSSAFEVVSQDAFDNRTTWFYLYGLPASLAMMLLGMALFRAGALQGRWTTRQYLALAAAGYAIGLPISLAEAMLMWRSGWDPLIGALPTFVTYELGRVPMTLGHLGLALFVWKRGWLQSTLRRLAAAGRMAFTNYLAQNAICMFLFTGVGLGLYGQLARHQLYYVVLGIWLMQLLWSPWWLARYRYGPLEWLWRALTFGERPPSRPLPGARRAPEVPSG